MVKADDLRDLIGSHHEWLLVREFRRPMPLRTDELEVEGSGRQARLGFVDENGFRRWRVHEVTFDGGEFTLDLTGAFGAARERIRLVPRSPASELAAEIETARLARANDIAALICESFPGVKLRRVMLNELGGRIAQVLFDDAAGSAMAAMADLTGTIATESVLTGAMLWYEKLRTRKKGPPASVWLILEKRHARNTLKLQAMLVDGWKERLRIIEVVRKPDETGLVELPARKLRDLWRQKASKLAIPEHHHDSDIAYRIIELAPDEIDMVSSRNGVTLRFLGLPFARVRTLMGVERAWFGLKRDQQLLEPATWPLLERLSEDLKLHRNASASNRRHELFRTASEAWLEALLRRNISLLDGNLIVSPIYNQFRSSDDRIDLLALRRDGRLVLIELKTRPDREMVFQAADYWRKIELQRRRGLLAKADLFAGREIIDKPALVYLVAPAWAFHRDHEFFARAISPEIEMWRFELHEDWRREVKVIARHNYSEGFTNR